jgi:putative methanogenesis marker protein 14
MWRHRPTFGYKPRIAKSRYTPLSELRVGRKGGQITGETVSTPLFTVASVELGNTTTKCVLTSTNLKTGRIYLIDKTVRLTREIRKPKTGEETFGKTIWEQPLSRESVKEFVRDVLNESLNKAKIDRDKDLNFVVRSSGVTAGFTKPEEVGEMIKALASGCLAAGINHSKMVAPLSKENLPPLFQPYSQLDKAPFKGAVAGSFPPRTASEIVANEMEAELSSAGIKLGAKWTDVDFRNPVLSLDFGTTFKGRATDGSTPCAQVIGSICGLAGAICDAVVQGAQIPFALMGEMQFLPSDSNKKKADWELAEKQAEEIHKYIKVEQVPTGSKSYGTVPTNPKAAEEAHIFLIGCDAGKDGSNFPKLRELGSEINKGYGLLQLYAVLDYVSALIVNRVLNLAISEGLIHRETSIGITGRAGITRMKPYLILRYIEELGLYKEKAEKRTVFVEDGLALGANVMARCMNGLGTPRNPLGGNRGMGCVLGEKMKRC